MSEKGHETLAIQGGNPVRSRALPYGRQCVDEGDVRAVVEVLESDWLTTGPAVERFEAACSRIAGAAHAVAVSSGTAALHAAAHAMGIGPGDEVVVSPLTFAATANCVVFEGATPVFADVDPETLLLDPQSVQECLTDRTRGIIAVDYAGQPCDYSSLRDIADRQDALLVADACHSLGATYRGRPVGSLADLTIFSFHPVKHVTTGEGGMVTTDDGTMARRMRMFRNHGITTDHRERAEKGDYFYEMVELGYNYRISDIQCALGTSQLGKLPAFVEARRRIAARYDAAFSELDEVKPIDVRSDVEHSYHLYPIRLATDRLLAGRDQVFSALLAEGIGVNVHYIPVHFHPYYRQRFGVGPGLCPEAESAYEQLITLPMFPAMSDADVRDVVESVRKVIAHYRA